MGAGHLTLVPELRDALGRPDIMIVVGGVIPAQDFDELIEAGAAAIFPPGTVIAEAAMDLVDKLEVILAITDRTGPSTLRPAENQEPTP